MMYAPSPHVRLIALIVLFVTTAGVVPSLVAADDAAPFALPRTHVHHLSAENDRVYRVMVALPEGYDPGGTTHYPVLYVLDARIMFASTVMAYRAQRMGRPPEPIIIVGIDYPEELTRLEWMARRASELTPTHSPAEDALFTQGYRNTVVTGGAPVFREVLRSEIMPLIDQAYRTSGDRSLLGFSLGGLFAAYDLFQEDRLFSRYAIASPALWWEGGAFIEGLEQAYAVRHKDMDVTLFLSVGTGEVTDMVEPLKAFGHTLAARSYPSLEMTTHLFDGEDHMTVVPATVSRVIRALFVTMRAEQPPAETD